MGRAYAGILGPLAFVTMLAREYSSAASTSTKLMHAWLALVLFGVLGSLIGRLAARIVEDSARSQILAEVGATEPKQTA